MRLYVASSWRNALYPQVVEALRELGHDVYDFRNPGPDDAGFSWSEIDPNWEQWTTLEYREALDHPAARRGFGNDLGGMERADACVLVLLCGRSAHLEAGWFMGRRLPCAVLIEGGLRVEPELMNLLSVGGPRAICSSVAEVDAYLETFRSDAVREHVSVASDSACEGPRTAASRNADEAPVFVLSEGRGNGRAHGVGSGDLS